MRASADRAGGAPASAHPASGVAAIGARRSIAERALRTAVFALLVLAIWRLWRATDPGADEIHIAFESSPTAVTRDSLAAHRRVGDSITWSGPIAPLAAMAERVRDPGDRWRVSVVGGDAIGVHDALGAVDSLGAGERTLTVSAARGALRAIDGATVAYAEPAERLALGRVAVLGRAGWEAKFVIAALEEDGWGVDARLSLGREREVVQGDPRPRAGRHAVVVVLDTTIGVSAAELARFVRSGGGLVLAGVGARLRGQEVTSITPGRVVAAQGPLVRDFDLEDPLRALPLQQLGAAREDAVVLAERDGDSAIAVRRVGAGRVAQMGFGETWRWRMQGGDRGVREHRAFWSSIVAGVAGVVEAPAEAGAAKPNRESAPLAQLTHALGPAAVPAAPNASRGPALPPWLGAAVLLVALAEWGSRRSRGAV